MMNGKILFVEDEEDLVMIVADTLRGEGYNVTTAADGREGLMRFKTEGADIVVADVMMPRMDGFAMAREIRKISPKVPLLFLTAKSTIDDVEKGFELGANDYLKKPFEFGRGIPLTYFEARILEHLAANIGKTVDASELMRAVWGNDNPSNRNSLHGYIHKLRRTLRQDPTVAIINQRGFGYMLTIKSEVPA